MKKTIAIFGGAFDPVHKDHALIGRGLLLHGLADEVWFVPSPDRWDKKLSASAGYRLAMLRLALQDEPRFVVSDLEIRMGEFRGSYEFLRAVSALVPEAELRLVIGSDSYASIPQWRDPLHFTGSEYNGIKLLKEFSLIVFARTGFSMPDVAAHSRNGYKLLYTIGEGEGFLGCYASSQIRKVLLESEKMPEGLEPSVYDYIKANRLYEP